MVADTWRSSATSPSYMAAQRRHLVSTLSLFTKTVCPSIKLCPSIMKIAFYKFCLKETYIDFSLTPVLCFIVPSLTKINNFEVARERNRGLWCGLLWNTRSKTLDVKSGKGRVKDRNNDKPQRAGHPDDGHKDPNWRDHCMSGLMLCSVYAPSRAIITRALWGIHPWLINK